MGKTPFALVVSKTGWPAAEAKRKRKIDLNNYAQSLGKKDQSISGSVSQGLLCGSSVIFVTLWWKLTCEHAHHRDTENTKVARGNVQNSKAIR